MLRTRLTLCLASLLAGLLLTVAFFAVAQGAQAAPPRAVTTIRPYPGDVPCNTTLQACINGSTAGDIIQIAAGTFTETFTLSKAVSLAGAGAGLTVLHAQPSRRVFSVTYTTTQPITISGLTIAGGDVSAAMPPYNNGGGVYLHLTPALVTFDSVIFRDNTARSGGGLDSNGVHLSISNTVFLNNTAVDFGGGVRSWRPITLTQSQLLGNVAGYGGGLLASDFANVQNVTFIGNVATGTGAYYAYGGGAATSSGRILNSRFESNSVAGGFGGGLWTSAGLISETVFLSNTAAYGGGLHANVLTGLAHVTFTANTADLWGGGGYFVHGAVLTDALAVGNAAADGGAFFFSNLSRQAQLTGAVLEANHATSPAGTAGIVFGYQRAPSQTVDALVNVVVTGTGAPNSRALQVGLGHLLVMTNVDLSGYPIELVNLGEQTARPTGYFTETAGLGLCEEPGFITYTRPITVWYGSLSAAGVPVFGAASASDRLAGFIPRAMELDGYSPRLTQALQAWTDPTQSFLELLLISDGLDAEANLRAMLAAAWRPAPYTGVRFAAPVAHGTADYSAVSYPTFEECGEGFQDVTHDYRVHITVVELNATAVIPVFLPLVVR